MWYTILFLYVMSYRYGSKYSCIANIFSHSIGYLLVCWFFCCSEAFHFDAIPLVYFCYCCLCFGVISKNSLPRPMSRSFFLMFYFRSFMVSNLMFKSLIQFEVIFNELSVEKLHIVITLTMLNGCINLSFEYISCLHCWVQRWIQNRTTKDLMHPPGNK